MPTYQYACTECGHRLEAVQSFSDDPLAVCPNCSGKLRKLFSAVGIVFKGSGFYRNDSRAGNGGSSGTTNGSDGSAPAKSEGPAKESSGKSESGKSESSKSESSKSESSKSESSKSESTKSDSGAGGGSTKSGGGKDPAKSGGSAKPAATSSTA